jgi:hypothetical protein
MTREVSQKIVDKAFHEVMHNEPSTVKKKGRTKAQQHKQKVAIALSKARQAGADIPEK